MRIKKSLTNKVKVSLQDCRKQLILAIIELCKQIDKNESGTIAFLQPFVLSNVKMDKRSIMFNVEHMVVTHIIYGPTDRMDQSFILECDETGMTSSIWLSIGDLEIVYNQIVKVVRNE